jgi:predicted ATPase/DNA-binding SARP family transcriptional activator
MQPLRPPAARHRNDPIFAMPVRLHLFGTPTLDVGDGRPASALPFERSSQLVVLLALRGSWVARSELAAQLWPGQTDKLAFSNLRKTLFRLQSRPWGDAIESQGASMRMAAATDVQEFETALREQRVTDALALYRGALLGGFDDDANEAWTSWLRFERDRLHAAWRDAALAHLLEAGADAEALALSARLLDSDPLDEAALRAHVTLLARGGQSRRAREVFNAFAVRLKQELGLAPGAELQALHDAIGHAAAQSAAAVASGVVTGAAVAGAGEDGFVGRAAERRRIAAELARDDVRLLSLTGPGGIGKTRLAQRAARDLSGIFADGAHLVQLEDAAETADVLARIAQATDVALRGRASALEQLCAALAAKQLLLVLDNMEQLADAAPPLLEPLLAACPRLKLLVTTRERLGLAAEHVLPLEGLPCPEVEDSDRIDDFDAVRLFVAAARRVEPALLPAAEARAIVEICHLVDGLPLALELAAAWTRVLSCEAIAAELRESTELLRASDATHPARHASIEQVFDQSWRRLAPAERNALLGLSVFRGGFRAEAARAVAAAPLVLLSALADKSLLRKDGARLTLHPLVQQLSDARLSAQQRAQVRAAHAAYFHRQLAQLRKASAGGDRLALQTIDVEFENARLAWQYAIEHGQADALRRSALPLFEYADHRARFDDALALARMVLDSPLAARDPGLGALLRAQSAWVQARLGRYEPAEVDARAALATAQDARDTDAQFQALSTLGTCTWVTGRLNEAREHFSQALRLARNAGLAHESATVFENLSLVEKHLGEYEASFSHARDALAQHRANNDVAAVALCLSNLGSTAIFMDDLYTAAGYLRESLELADRHGLASTRVYALANLTELAIKNGDREAARAHAERAVNLTEAAGLRALAAWLKAQLARLAAQRGEFDEARALLADAAAAAIELKARSMQAAVLLALAELLEAQGDAGAGRRVLGFACEEPTLGAPDRDELRVEWARRAAGLAQPDPPWPGLPMVDLLQRVVTEAHRQHAGLRGLLAEPFPAAR